AATSNTSLAVIKLLTKYKVNIFAISQTREFKDRLTELGVCRIFEPAEVSSKNIHFMHFDAVVDPFYDIYMEKVTPFIKNGGKYISCGLYQQNKYYKSIDSLKEGMYHIFNRCLTNNISLIGNCLGTVQDLSDVIDDVADNRFDILIDSVYTVDSAEEFISKSFHKISKLGKVIFRYE